MSSSVTSPQMLGRRTQFSILELGIGAALAATAALGATLFALTQDPADASAGAARQSSPPAAVSTP
ncbi:hypothetical protein [Dietzia sp. UBA5065]|jgi:hypothetical protein|uniref:hypothetical protein n=1 Tax=Dietzia sp. UBA5065 TaxID=1946422 RepID=UPI0025C6FF83|nr:hypothetical protein [Dietzia sp. UBA5065]HMT50411.1 hypothetical protein [Dietzia sp.]